MKLLLDPKFFNYVIMTLYGVNSLRWAINGSWADVIYWMSALSLVLVVTFGYKH
jgi:hypothetical protein